MSTVTCPGIGKGGGRKSERFFCLSIFQGGGAAPKTAEKLIFPTKKVAKYRLKSMLSLLDSFATLFLRPNNGRQETVPVR